MRTLTAFLFAALALVAGPAQAASLVYDLDVISNSSIGSGSLGTVTLTEDGGNVDVVVSLAPNTGFVRTGGHYSFSFNVGDHTVSLSSTSAANFAVQSGSSFKQDNWYFENALICTNCSTGGSNPYYGALEFTVSGVSLSDFVSATNKQGDPVGIFFAADVLGPGGRTGLIAADNAVPLPAALPLFGSSLLGLGALAWRKRVA